MCGTCCACGICTWPAPPVGGSDAPCPSSSGFVVAAFTGSRRLIDLFRTRRRLKRKRTTTKRTMMMALSGPPTAPPITPADGDDPVDPEDAELDEPKDVEPDVEEPGGELPEEDEFGDEVEGEVGEEAAPPDGAVEREPVEDAEPDGMVPPNAGFERAKTGDMLPESPP